MPEKSGTDAAPRVALPPGPTAGAAVCPQAVVAAAAANAANKRKARRGALMISSFVVSPVLIQLAGEDYTEPHALAREGRVRRRKRNALGQNLEDHIGRMTRCHAQSSPPQ
jgi:hypothetical protein